MSMKIYGVVLLMGFCHGNILKMFEFENAAGGAGHSRTPWRSGASNLSALHVFKGDKVNLNLCLPETTTLFLSSVSYSNDGPADNVSIKLDGAHFKTFETQGNDGDFGNLWNVPLNETQIGEGVSLEKGVHTMEFTFEESDCYGTELDNIVLSLNVNVSETDLFCDSNFQQAPEAIRTPCAVEWDAPKPKPADQIAPPTKEMISAGTKPESTSSTQRFTETTVVSTTSISTVTKTSTILSTISHSTTQTVAPPTTEVTETTQTITMTTTPLTSASTAASTPLETTTSITPNSISQLSFNSTCLVESNVNIVIHPTSLKNTEIIARSSAAATGNQQSKNIHEGLHCETDIWRIGENDDSNKEHSTVTQTGTVDFDVNIKNNGTRFPGNIDFATTPDVFLNYIIPKKFTIRKGRVHFVLGLTGVTKDVSIGLKYYDRAKKNAPEVEYKTFTQNEQTINWVIPSRAVSPSLQNVIHIMPEKDERSRVSIDFMKLKFIPRSSTTHMKLLTNTRKWKVRGQIYKVPKRAIALPDGMSVEIDSKMMQGVYSEVDIIKKPNIKVLAITEGGEVFLSHGVKPGRGSNGDRGRKDRDQPNTNQRWRQTQDVSGFTFGNTDAHIDKVSISPATSEVLLTYDDGNFVKFTYDYSKVMSKLTVTDTSFTSGPLSFVSTFLSNAVAGVNELSVDGGKSQPIMSPSLHGLTGNNFKFKKTRSSFPFDSNNDFEVVLPN